MAKAQPDFRPGYIITLKGDTVKGLINYRGDIANAKACVFRNGSDREKTIYSPDQIRSYRFIHGKYYISSNFLNYNFDPHVFLEYLIKGPVSIFYYRDEINDHYFTQKDTLVMELDHGDDVPDMSESNDVEQAKSQRFKGQLKALLKDQPSLFKEIDGITCNTKNLISLTKDYQKLSCPSEECLVYEKKTFKDVNTRLGIYFSGGYSHLSSPPYNIYISDYNVIKSLNFKPGFTYEIGSTFNLYLNFITRNKFIIQLSPALNFVKYRSYVERQLAPLLYSYETHVKFTTLKIPLTFKYSFYSSIWRVFPYLKFGVVSAIYLKQKGIYEYRTIPLTGNENLATDYRESLTTNHFSRPLKFYVTGSAGTDIKWGKRLLFIGVIYEYGNSQLDGFRSDAQLQSGFLF